MTGPGAADFPALFYEDGWKGIERDSLRNAVAKALGYLKPDEVRRVVEEEIRDGYSSV